MYAIWAVQWPYHFSKVKAEMPRGTEPDILLNLFEQCNSLLKDRGEALETFTCCAQSLLEHNLRLKPTKCKFFWDDVNYLAHHVSKEGLWPSKENLKGVAEFFPLQTYMEIWAFLGLVGHYRQFIKGFAHIVQPLHEHLSRESACEKSNWVMLMAEAKDTFETLKKACLIVPVLAFADFNMPFPPETDVSKLGLGTVLSQKQINGGYHPVA